MNRKAIIVLFLILALAGVKAYSQNSLEQSAEPGKLGKALQKLRWDMNLGTAYTFSPGYGGGMSYYASPGFSMPVGRKFSFHGGVTAGAVSSPALTHSEGSMQNFSSGFTSIYGTGAYHLNQNVIFYASGVKSIHTFGKINPLFNPSYNEISFGSSIRLGENVTIGASVHFREYQSIPYMNDFAPYFW